MDEICGECKNPYSLRCQIKQYCKVHSNLCFSCRNCSKASLDNLYQCLRCNRKCQQDEAFYHPGCDGYLCIREISKVIKFAKEVLLPCGCRELKEHTQSFTRTFCYKCKRRLTKKSNSKQLMMCHVCYMYSQCKQEGTFAATKFQPIQSVDQSNQSGINKLKQSQIDKSQNSENLSVSFLQDQQSPYKEQPYSQPQQDEQEKMQKQQQKTQQLTQDEKTLIKLKNELNTTALFLRLSEFARMQFQKTLMNERDQQCPLCILPFSLKRRPMMICLQQHLVCDVCLSTVKNLYNCPLCRELIRKQKVSVYREGLNLLQIDKYFNEKVKGKYNRFERFSKETKDQSFNYKLAHELIQTQGNQSVNIQNSTKKKYFAVRHDLLLKSRMNKKDAEQSSQKL